MDSKKKIIIKISLSLLIAIIAVGCAFAVAYFFGQQLSLISQSIQEKKKVSYIMQNRELTNLKIKNDFKLAGENYEANILAALPTVDNILPFVDSMDSLAKKNNLQQTVTFNSLVPIAGTEPLNLTSINFTLAITNVNVLTFNNYLSDFEKLPYFAGIDSISLIGSNNNGWNDNSTISISGKIYAREPSKNN